MSFSVQDIQHCIWLLCLCTLISDNLLVFLFVTITLLKSSCKLLCWVPKFAFLCGFHDWIQGSTFFGENPIEVMCPSVLVCYGCHDRVPQMEAWTTGIYFLAVLEAESLRSRCWKVCYVLKPLSWACRRPHLLCSHVLFPLCTCVLVSLCVSTFPFLRTPVRLD